MTSRLAAINAQHLMMMPMPEAMASVGLAYISAVIWSRWDQMTYTATEPTRPALASVLISSTTVWAENMRCTPLSGFMRSNLGASALLLNVMPPSAIE